MHLFTKDHLDVLNSITLQLQYAGRKNVGPKWHGKNASAEYSRLYYVISGEAYIRTETETYCLSPKKWYLLPAGCQFDYHCPVAMDHFYYHLKLCSPNGFDLLRCCEHPRSITLPETYNTVAPSSENTLLDSIELRQKLYAVITAILRADQIPLQQATFSACVENAILYINTNLHAGLTLSLVAEKSFVSRSTLTKHFRRELGTSVNAYIMDTLLSQARQQIISTTLPIRTISENLGFSDQFYFSKCFKAKYGLPPQKYRQQPFA